MDPRDNNNLDATLSGAVAQAADNITAMHNIDNTNRLFIQVLKLLL